MAPPATATKPAPGARPSFLRSVMQAVVSILALLFLIVVAWVCWLNYRHDGRLSFRLFDRAWWQPGLERSGPVIDSAREAERRADKAVWGDHGLVDEVSQWFSKHSHPGSPPPAAAPAGGTPAAAPPATGASPERAKLELFLGEAEGEFSVGLDLYRQASQNPDDHGALGLLRQARQHMLSCKDLLDSTLPAYGRVADHDADRAEEDAAMQGYNQRLLQSVDAHLGLLPPG